MFFYMDIALILVWDCIILHVVFSLFTTQLANLNGRSQEF